MAKNFAKLTKNLTEISKYTRKSQKFWYIFDIRRYMSKIDSLFLTYTIYVENEFEYCQKYTRIFDIFRLIFGKFHKNDSKRVENQEFYTGNFDNRLSTI